MSEFAHNFMHSQDFFLMTLVVIGVVGVFIWLWRGGL